MGPAPATVRRASTSVPADATAARAARHFATERLRRWGLADAPFDLLLVISELVTNAVVHGTPPLELRLAYDGSTVAVEVRDGGDGAPVVSALSDEAASGRGLAIVEAVAGEWGVAVVDDGKAVWARLVVDRQAVNA